MFCGRRKCQILKFCRVNRLPQGRGRWGDHLELNRNFAPYQGEPLADSEDADIADDDEDGILPSVFEQCSRGKSL